jgi:hypothetical protein
MRYAFILLPRGVPESSGERQKKIEPERIAGVKSKVITRDE